MKAWIIINEETLQEGVVSYFTDEQKHSGVYSYAFTGCLKTKHQSSFFSPSIHVFLKLTLVENRIHAKA